MFKLPRLGSNIARIASTLKFALLALGFCGVAAAQDAKPEGRPKVVVYSGLEPQRLAGLAGALAQDAGIELVVEYAADDLLLGRVLREGPQGRADILLVSNAARLERAAAAGLLQPVALAMVEQAVPAGLREPNAHWFAIGWYARAFAVGAGRARPAPANYADLAGPQLDGKLCLPGVARLDSRTLLAAMIHHRDVAQAEIWARAVALNAVPRPGAPAAGGVADDRALIEAVVGGACDVAVVSSRALAQLQDQPGGADRALIDRIEVVWPNQLSTGAFIDIVGAAVTATSDKREAVLKTLAYLVTDTGQRLLAEGAQLFPAKPGVPLTNALTRWGPFRADETPLHELLTHLPAAGAMAARAGWR